MSDPAADRKRTFVRNQRVTTILNIIKSNGSFVWNPYSWRKLDITAGSMLKSKQLVIVGKRKANEIFLGVKG